MVSSSCRRSPTGITPRRLPAWTRPQLPDIVMDVIVQMPSGVPVACVAINGARNAAILATQILGTSMPQYRHAVERLKLDMAGS